MASPLAGPVRAQLPSTDIWIAELRAARDEVHIGRPQNVTRRTGYDNQPCFFRDRRGFLFSRGDSTGTDVYVYDIRSGKVQQVTTTPESEYSPTPFADSRDGFYAVRVEADSTQRLWRFESDGSRPRPVLAAVDSVGYFAWLDASTVALFVVGEPHTLRVVDLETERETVIARDIGRALLRAPRERRLTFLLREPQSDPARYVFHTWRPPGSRVDRLIDARGAGQDAAWVGATLVMAEGSKLYGARAFDSPDWVELADLGTYGLAGITRIAVSPDRRWIALVAVEAP